MILVMVDIDPLEVFSISFWFGMEKKKIEIKKKKYVDGWIKGLSVVAWG